MKNKIYTNKEILDVLLKSWSLESSSKWSKDNPAKGQCGVTALVVNDIMGGEIKKTKLPSGWHFYNVLNGKRCDFTDSQFTENIIYMDIPSNRDEAYKDTNKKQYNYLIKRSVVWYKMKIKHANRLPITTLIGRLFFVDK